MDRYENLFNDEPTFKCPLCGTILHTDWVDNGFGRYAVQVSPYACSCGWIEGGCPAKECIKEKCFSWDICQGKSLNKK